MVVVLTALTVAIVGSGLTAWSQSPEQARASVQLNCSAAPNKCGYPDATNTGIAPGVQLTPSRSVNVTRDAQVVQNLSIHNGTINVAARNVVIRNVKIVIDSPELWAIIVRPGASATIEHVDISGVDAQSHSVENAVLSQSRSPVRVDHANLYNCSACIQGEYVTATANYLHDLRARSTGIQCNAVCNMVATGNTVVSRGTAIALFGDFGTPRDSTISGNLVGGGSFVVYAGARTSTNIHVDNNRFSRAVYPNGGRYGPVAAYYSNAGNTMVGNIWDDTGKLLSCPGCTSGPSASRTPVSTTTHATPTPTPSRSTSPSAPASTSRPPTSAPAAPPSSASPQPPAPAPVPAGSTGISGEQINASNTGIAGDGVSASQLTRMGGTTYGSSYNGQTISLKAYTGQVNISGSNITIKDCTLTNGGKNSIGFMITGANDTIDHCTITSPPGQSMYEPVWALEASSNVRVTRNDISRGDNLLTTYGAGVLIENNYMHDTETESDPSDHPDGIEVYGGHDVDIKANRIVEGNLYDAPINYAPYSNNTGNNLTIEDNFLDNGQSDILVDNQSSHSLTNTRVFRNALGGHQNPSTGDAFGRYHPLLNEQGRPIVQDEAGLAANPSAIEWPSSGPNANYWAENSDLIPNKDGQIAIPN